MDTPQHNGQVIAHIEIKQPEEAYRLCVIGVPGAGKSVYRDKFLSRIMRVTLWNPMVDFNIGDDITVDEYRDKVEEFRKGALRVTVSPTSYDEIAMAEEFNALCAYVEEVGAQHFAIEEIALVARPNNVPPNLNKIYIRGRHRAISLSAYGQRFHQFPLIVRGTASQIIAFRQTDPDDVKDFERRIAPDVSPVPLNRLPDYHFIDWTPEHGAVLRAPLPYTENREEEERLEGKSSPIANDTFFNSNAAV
jgi:hypothetical protein